jgi:hypothetical protein
MNFNRNFAIHTNFALEKTKGNNFSPFGLLYNNKNEGIFYGTSLTTKELSLFFDFDRTKIYLGKIEPKFAGGSERGSDFFYENWYGISGTFLNQGYILDEKIGLLLDVAVIEREDVRIVFQGSVFTNDNTDLYKKPFFEKRQIEFLVTPPGQTKRQAGSAIINYAVSMQGFVGLSKRDVISFGVGYKNQSSSDSNNDISEQGFSLTSQYTRTFFDDLTLSLFAENVEIWNAYTLSGFRETYNTIGVSSGFAGIRVGLLQNYYKSKYQNSSNKITLNEYFIGFEVPKTELGFFVSYKQYKMPANIENISGFGFNIRYRVK